LTLISELTAECLPETFTYLVSVDRFLPSLTLCQC